MVLIVVLKIRKIDMAHRTKKIIIGYVRKSKEDKNAKAISPESQREYCYQYAIARGCEFVCFEDINKHGDNLNRPGFKALVEFIKANPDCIICIVVWRLDRISRSMEDYYGTIQPMLKKYGITIASIDQHFDDVFQLDSIMLAVYMGQSEQELRNIKRRTISTIQYRARSGYLLGKAPIGYMNTRTEDKRGIVVPDPDKAHYIKRAYELYATGLFSYEMVGKELAKYGFVDSKGKPYPKKRIEDILKSVSYIGKVEYKGEIYDGKHEAIIDSELFYRVQLLIGYKRKTRSNVRSFVYSNFIQCAKCNYQFIGEAHRGAHNSGNYIYYRCSNYSKAHASQKYISESIIDEAMQEVIESFDITDNELKGIRKLIYKSITELQSYEHKSIKELQKQYDDLTIVIANGAKQKLLGKLDVDDTTYKELMKKWQREKDEIGSRIANLSANSKDTMTRMDILTDFANKIPELYLKANVEEKRIIIGTITDRIILDVENNKIKVKLKPVFEYLRQLKLQNKESFSADIENLSRTLKTRTNNGTQAVENRHVDLDELTVIRTRKKLLNTEIEPHIEALNEINVDGGT